MFFPTPRTFECIVSDIPNQLAAIPFTPASVSLSGGCMPVSVTALLDGSRFYVANYQTATTARIRM